MAAVTSFQTALARLVLATTLASITMATPQSIPGLDNMELLRTASQEINTSDNIANLKMTVEGSNILTNGSVKSNDSSQGKTRDWPLQQETRDWPIQQADLPLQVEGIEEAHFDYDGPNLEKIVSNETELLDSNLISSRRGRMLGRLTKFVESATSALLGNSPEPADSESENPKPQDPAPPNNTSALNPDESVQYVQAVRIPDHMRSQMVNKLRTKHQDQQHEGSSPLYDRQGKNYANYNDERFDFHGNTPTSDTPTSQSLFETFQSLFSKNMKHSTGKLDNKEHREPPRPLAQLDRRPFHSNPLNVKKDDKHIKHPSHITYYNAHNDLPFFHEPSPLDVDGDEYKNVKSHFKSVSKINSEYPESKDYSEAFRPPRPYNTRPDAVASSVEITTFKPTVRYPVTTQTPTASNPQRYTMTLRRSDSPREIRNAPVSHGILNHNLANANEVNDAYYPESSRYDRHQTVQYMDSVSPVHERSTKQFARPPNLFDTNQRPGNNRDLIPRPHFQDSNELYSPSPRDETNNHLINRPTVEHHRDTNSEHHSSSMASRHPTSLPPHHHTFPPTVKDSSVERFAPPKTSIRHRWSPTTSRPEATVITASPRQSKSVEYPHADYYVRDNEPIFQDPRSSPMEVQYFEALEDEIRGSKFLTESVRLVSSNTFDDLIRETLANKKKTHKSTKPISERTRPSRIRPSAPYNDIQSNEIIQGKIHPQTQAPRLIKNKIVIDIQDSDDHHSPPGPNTRHRPAPTPSNDALIDSMYNFRNFETPMVKFSSKEAWRNIDINKYLSNEYSSQTEQPSKHPIFRPRDLHRPPSPTSRSPSPTSRRPSPTSRPPSKTSRPHSPTPHPPSPTSHPLRPVSPPSTTVSGHPSPTSRPHSSATLPRSPASRPHSQYSRHHSSVSHPHSQVSRPHSPASHHHGSVSHPSSQVAPPHSSVSHPHSQVSHPHSSVSHPHSQVSHPHSSVSHPHSQVSHPHSSVSHPHSQVSHPHSSVSHPHSQVSHPHSQVSHPQSPVSHPPTSVSHPPTEHKKTIVTKYYYEKPTEDKSLHLPQNDRFAAEHKTLDHPPTRDNLYNHYELVDHFPPKKEDPLFTYGRPETASEPTFFDDFHDNHDDRTRSSGVFDHMFQTQKPRSSLSIEEIFLSKPLSRIDPPPGYHPFQGNSPPDPRRPETLTTYRPKYSAAAEARDRDSSARFAEDSSSNSRKLDDYSSIFTENMGSFHLPNMNNRQSNYHIGSEPTYEVLPTMSIGIGASYQTTKSPSKRPGEPIVFTSMPYFGYSSRSGYPSEDVTPQPSSVSDKEEEPKGNLTEIEQYVRESRMSRSEKGATSFVVPTISQTKQYVREPRMSQKEKEATSFVVPTVSQTNQYVREPRMSQEEKEATSFVVPTISQTKQYVREPRMSQEEKGATSFVGPTISLAKQYVREPRMSREENKKSAFVVPTFSQREIIATPSLLAAFLSQKRGKTLYERLSSVEQKPVLGSTEPNPEVEQVKSLDSGGNITANAGFVFPQHGYNIDEFFERFPVFSFFEKPVGV